MRNRWLIAVAALFAVAAVFAARYGPHVVWKTVHADSANGVEPIATTPMAIAPADEPISTCTIGPVSFVVPTSMTKNVEYRRGIGGMFVGFRDDARSFWLSLPEPSASPFHDSVEGFPEKAQLSFPRLYKEVCEAKSADFSFAMSRRELAWHRWLLTQRQLLPDDLKLVEYAFRDDLDGHLVVVSGDPVFQWDTTDLKWDGTIYFRDASAPGKVTDWMRRTSASLAVNGDPSILSNKDEQVIRAMLSVSDGPK